MHICAIDDRLAHDTKWCPTLGECETCGGLVCEHGCQRNRYHGTRHWITGPKDRPADERP